MRAFEDFNPIVVFVYYTAVTLMVMFTMNPVLLMLSFAGSLVYCLVKGGTKAGFHVFISVMFAVITLINPLFYHNGTTVLFIMNNNPVTLEALIYGVFSGCMLVSVFYWFRTFSKIMTGDRLLYVFGSLSPKIALLLSMTLRYIPLFAAQTKKTEQAQRALGLYKEDNFIDSIRGGTRILSVMVSWGLENGIITADSMTARGYGCGRRTFFSLYRFRLSDIVLLSLTAVLSAAVIIGLGSGALDYTYYPSLGELPSSSPAIISYASYGLLAALPTVIDTEEGIRWKFLKSKI